jgi:hypothetical protein
MRRRSGRCEKTHHLLFLSCGKIIIFKFREAELAESHRSIGFVGTGSTVPFALVRDYTIMFKTYLFMERVIAYWDCLKNLPVVWNNEPITTRVMSG